MTLGEIIREMRTRRGISQGDLADALDVSRQSVSKWENDLSVPELDKLISLAELFGVTLDALVHGNMPDEPEGTQPPGDGANPTDTVSTSSSARDQKTKGITGTQKIIGTILLCFGALIFLLLLLGGGGWFSLLFALPFFLTGILCLTCRSRVGLWCAWAIYFSVDLYLNIATGANRSVILWTFQYSPSMNYAILAIAWGLVLVLAGLIIATLVSYRKLTLTAAKQTVTALICLVIGILATYVIGALISGVLLPSVINMAEDGVFHSPGAAMRWVSIALFLLTWVRLALYTASTAVALAMIRTRKSKRSVH